MSLEFNRITEVKKPTKQRHCQWCWELIRIGERCFHFSQVFDGDFHSFYMHPECEKAFHEVDWRDYPDGWMPGDFARGSTSE